MIQRRGVTARNVPGLRPVLEKLEERALLTTVPAQIAWVPNDAQISKQYDLINSGQQSGKAGADIQASQAWNNTTGSRLTSVAIFDTGMDYTHPDLYLNTWINQKEIPASRKANLTDVDRDGAITFRDLNNPINIGAGKILDLNKNGYIDGGDLIAPMARNNSGRDTGLGGWTDGISQDGDRYVDDLIGWNFINNTNNPLDDHGHGTHVAGTIGAVGNNGIGVAGVTWQVSMAAIKVGNANGAISLQGIVDGLAYATSKGIRVSNHSYEFSSYSQQLFDAMKLAGQKGLLIIAAAGNRGLNMDVQPSYPAAFNLPNVVAVASTDRKDMLASSSNRGAKTVQIAAPGVDIYSTLPNKSYGLKSGTSMAAPHVTGAVALVLGLRPEWTYQQVMQQILSSADRIPSLDGKVSTGRLNLAAAVRVPPRGSGGPGLIASAPPSTLGTSSFLIAGPSKGAISESQETAPPMKTTVKTLDECFSSLTISLLEKARKERRGW